MAEKGNQSGTAVAKREEPRRTVTTHITELVTSQQARAFIEPFLPPGTDIQRVAASLILAIKQDDSGKLKQCTPESLLTGVARIMQWGAELGVTAYLIPFGKEATPVRDYKFLAELSGACGYPMEGHAVHAGDDFAFEYGLNPVLRHVPRAKKSAQVTHAYVIVRPPRNATPIFHVMTAEEIEFIRQKYSKQWKAGPLPAWYAVKTTVRQATKLLPKDPRLARLVAAVEEEEAVELRAIAEPEPPAAAHEDPDNRGEAGEEQFLDDRWMEERDEGEARQ